MRVAVASIIQETNTFSALPTTLADFEAQGLWLGAEARDLSDGSNTEIAGAIEELSRAGADVIPVVRAWAMSGGTLVDVALAEFARMLTEGLRAAGPIDGVVLALHGALVAESEPHADAALAEAARAVIPSGTPLVVSHDLHANVTQRIVDAADAVLGFHTYPHVDQAETGRRAARLLLRAIAGEQVRTVLAKRPMIVPAEAQAIAQEPMRGLRALADDATDGPIVDVSLFPVQPWLDVPELGFGVTVTYAGPAADRASGIAGRIADRAYELRQGFDVPLVRLDDAIKRLGPRQVDGCTLLVQSADSPTAGATADDASVISALMARPDLASIATVVDAPAVALSFAAGPGGSVTTTLGATLDSRWSSPVDVTATVVRVGDDPVILAGDMMTGQAISMGRWAVLDTGAGPRVLVTERPAPTFDPAGYRQVGLDPAEYDIVVVRSATMFRSGFGGLFREAWILDLPGASTPRFELLDFTRVPRPMYPLDRVVGPPAPALPQPVGDNRVPVYYSGGDRINSFRRLDPPVAGPEDWVASTCALPPAILAAGVPLTTGISSLPDGRLLTQAIEADQVGWLGPDVASHLGTNPGLLVKLLDAGERLPVHCHPTRDMARKTLGSIFGKTEGWIVMHAEPGASVWLGMGGDVDRADLRRWVDAQDVDAMLAAMLRLPVEAGDVVYVPAGIPHAIGPGIMVTELQEPTSFSILGEYEVFGLTEGPATLGLGWDTALDAFDLSSYADRRDYLFPSATSVAASAEGRISSLFSADADGLFRAWKVEASGSVTLPIASFAILVAIGGSGAVVSEGGRVDVRRGDTLVAPWACGPLTVEGDVSLIMCLPPEL